MRAERARALTDGRFLIALVVLAGVVAADALGSTPGVGRPDLPTAPLDRTLQAARSAGVDRSEPLARALVHVADHAPDERAGALLLLATQADPALASPHLALARRALGHFDLGTVATELIAALGATRLDAQQEAELCIRLVRSAHSWIWATLATLAVLFALRGMPLARHALGERLGSSTAASLLLIVPLITAFLVSVAIGCLVAAVIAVPFVRRRERACLAGLCVLLAWIDLGIRGCAPYAMLLDPRTHTHQLARLASGAHDLALESRWAASPQLDAEQELVLGLQARRRGDLETARAHYAACLERDPNCVPAYVNLANLFFRAGYYERAITGFRAAASLAPQEPLPRFNLGQTYIRTLHYGESDAELRAAAELGMAAVEKRRALWREDAVPVLDMSLSKSDLLRLARREADASPALRTQLLQSWKSRSWQSVNPTFAPWLLLGLAAWLVLELRVRTVTVLCTGCGTVVCAHCTAQEPAEKLCNACLLARPRVGPRVVGPDGAPPTPRRRIAIASGRWVAPLFPGAADLARESVVTATLTVAGAWAALLVATALFHAAAWRAGSSGAGAEAWMLRLVLLVLGLLWLPGLFRLRQRDRRPRPVVRAASAGA
jgi:tetratricopeptide (TPR) repeat protein